MLVYLLPRLSEEPPPLTERDYSHRTLLEKLGVKPEHRVAVRNIENAAFLAMLQSSLAKAPATALRGSYDLIFIQVNSPDDLATIAIAAKHLVPNGGLWIFHPKGKAASPRDSEVRTAGIAAGLVDNKVCAFNDTHAATRYVIPKTRRT